MDCQKIIETFFSMLGRFEFDRAKSYIDGRKEVIHKLAPTFPNQAQLMAMLTTFSLLIEAEKHYHNQPFSNQKDHSFLKTTNFLRKTKSLKDMYHEIFTESPNVASETQSTTSSTSGYAPPPNSTTTTPINTIPQVKEFSGELISHFCSQLQNFIQARLDMVDVYEKLTEASTKKYPSVDGISFHLSMLCRQYHKYFHHPLLAPIKEGMTLECESLMTLIRATIDMQHWRFLPTLFDLQEAQSKLNYWATNTFNKETSKRRFKVSKTQSPPRLYEWLCRFREFLVTKFTLYFHATLSRSFPPASFKSCSSKLPVDYYAKLSSYQRKIDAVFIALMYDVSNEEDFRGLGYNYPSGDYIKPQGKNTLQSMVVIPNENRSKLNSLQAEIYMIVVTNQQSILKDGHYQFHDNTKKMTYSICRPDSNVVLVMVCEGQKTDRDLSMRSFSLEITNQFAFSNIFNCQ